MKNTDTTYIKAKCDMFNSGLCFSKDNIYEVPKIITTTASLMDISIINNLGEKHNIGSWWRNFEIIETEND